GDAPWQLPGAIVLFPVGAFLLPGRARCPIGHPPPHSDFRSRRGRTRVSGSRHDEALQPKCPLQRRPQSASTESRLRRLHFQLLPEIQHPRVHDLHEPADRGALGAGQQSLRQGASLSASLTKSREILLRNPSEYLCHVYVRNDGLAGVVIADNEYPQRVCFTLLDKVLDEFSRQVSKIDWPSGSPATINYTALDGYLSKYQNPREADPMTRVQAELDETKIILHNTMESLLERGEKLDDLVSKSEVLGAQSKAFYKTARKQNSCCKIM
uniref:YKT6 v-SNARE homolog n=1 Tax=Apteryx owenii TaxID=8824 RepID=A0A8B9QMX4_APTOW